MVQETVFGNVIQFLERLGVYDVILPFILVFTIVFAIFEKTKIFGTEDVEGVKTAKKNLNAMIAFVIAFLVIASAQLVAIINKSLANIVLLLLISVCFLLLIGSFFSEKEEVKLIGGWRTFFMIVMLIGVVLIFLAAITTSSGKSWLQVIIDSVVNNFDSTAVSSIVLLIVVLIFMMYIVREPKHSHVGKSGHGEDNNDKEHH
ncbi:hypothetical protein J4232_05195 [Candidatus Woesearchaeota archaeon]|nr:hypothetical protein [Candidatus Woesearchaeota archaeon]